MEAFYLEIRQLHVAAALASGAWLALRGLVFFGGGYRAAGRWAAAAPLQWVAYTLDGVLLTAALMLMNVIEQFPTTHAWVMVKMLGLAAYVALASTRSAPAASAAVASAAGSPPWRCSVSSIPSGAPIIRWVSSQRCRDALVRPLTARQWWAMVLGSQFSLGEPRTCIDSFSPSAPC